MANVPSIGVSQPHVQSIGVSQSLDLTEYIVYPSPRLSLIDGLVGAWTMDEGAGTVVHDLSGHGDHGTVDGCERVVAEMGHCVEFVQANTDSIALPVTASCKGSPEWSLSMWFRRDGLSSDTSLYSEQTAGGYWRNTVLIVPGFGYKWYTRDTSTGDTGGRNNDLIANGNPGIGEWVHVVAVYSVSRALKAIYVDGVLLGSTGTSIDAFTATSPSHFALGDDPGGIDYYDGLMRQVLTWNRALMLSEIQQLYFDPDAWRPSKQLIAYEPVAVTGGVGRLIDGGLVNSGLVYGRLTG